MSVLINHKMKVMKRQKNTCLFMTLGSTFFLFSDFVLSSLTLFGIFLDEFIEFNEGLSQKIFFLSKIEPFLSHNIFFFFAFEFLFLEIDFRVTQFSLTFHEFCRWIHPRHVPWRIFPAERYLRVRDFPVKKILNTPPTRISLPQTKILLFRGVEFFNQFFRIFRYYWTMNEILGFLLRRIHLRCWRNDFCLRRTANCEWEFGNHWLIDQTCRRPVSCHMTCKHF